MVIFGPKFDFGIFRFWFFKDQPSIIFFFLITEHLRSFFYCEVILLRNEIWGAITDYFFYPTLFIDVHHNFQKVTNGLCWKKPLAIYSTKLKTSKTNRPNYRPQFNCFAWNMTKWTIFTLKTINYRFRSRIGIRMRNSQKIVEMNRHGDSFITFWFNSIQI